MSESFVTRCTSSAIMVMSNLVDDVHEAILGQLSEI